MITAKTKIKRVKHVKKQAPIATKTVGKGRTISLFDSGKYHLGRGKNEDILKSYKVGYKRPLTDSKVPVALSQGKGSQMAKSKRDRPQFGVKTGSMSRTADIIEKSARLAIKIIQPVVMEEALRLYKAYGLEEHELTGNTRASIMSAAITHGAHGVSGLSSFMSMDDTPEPKYNILSPTSNAFGYGGARIGERTTSSGKKWQYFFIRQYKTGKIKRFLRSNAIETGLNGKSPGHSRTALREIGKNLIKSNGFKLYGLGIVAMNPTYRAEIVGVMYDLQTFAQRLLYDAMKDVVRSGYFGKAVVSDIVLRGGSLQMLQE